MLKLTVGASLFELLFRVHDVACAGLEAMLMSVTIRACVVRPGYRLNVRSVSCSLPESAQMRKYCILDQRLVQTQEGDAVHS